MTMGVIVTVNHSVPDPERTITSVLGQTQPPDEVVVIGTGLNGSLKQLAARYPSIRLIPCAHANWAIARNTGIEESTSDALLFVTSKEFLLPTAVETSREFLEMHPEVDIALFDFEWTDHTGLPSWSSGRRSLDGKDLFLHLLAGDFAVPPPSVVYRRRSFDRLGLFRASAGSVCDRDFLLRAAQQRSTVVVENKVVTKYTPSELASKEEFLATRKILQEIDLTKYSREHARMRDRGLAAAEETYGGPLWKRVREGMRQSPFSLSLARQVLEVSACCPRLVGRELKQFAQNALSKRFYNLGTTQQKQVHHLRALAQLQVQGAGPVSSNFGLDRGLPVDRYYMEKFLQSQSGAIQGRVLEVKNNDYTVKFGGPRVIQSDVLHPDANWPDATIHGNLTDPSAFPSGAFDCVILTQTLHLIYDIRGALRSVLKMLKSEGTLLITVPAISKIYHLGDPGHLKLDQDSWRLTRWSLEKLLSEFFPPHKIAVEAAGNLAVNTAFLYGLAVQDLPPGVLDVTDADHELILMAVATK